MDARIPSGIVVGSPQANDLQDRAVHIINLPNILHNYRHVESAAARQRCSVITVVKADGYGHGALRTALYLADHGGAEAFAVATLEEGIALRKALDQTAGKNQPIVQPHPGINDPSVAASTVLPEIPSGSLRPNHVRILVLGPPVNFPRCFDDYHHYAIEAMISGPEVAASLIEWIHNTHERRRSQVELAATEAKERALLQQPKLSLVSSQSPTPPPTESSSGDSPSPLDQMMDVSTKKSLPHPSSTLGNVSGQDLAREVRTLLMNQAAAKQQKVLSVGTSLNNSSENSLASMTDKVAAVAAPEGGATNPLRQVFAGLEVAAKNSRAREVGKPAEPTRKRLRWHALVDSGMGRLGFKTDAPKDTLRDTVDILQELYRAEVHESAPIEFFGMCTHMADANATSTYTNSQIDRFVSLLKRVRAAGISVPSVSTDNSAALLTPNLTHFDPETILKQDNVYTRGYVRTGGAIFGQRPAFSELKSPSTLIASVRHVAIIQKGGSVGYDQAYRAPYDVRIATLTIGFADGYPRELGNGNGKVAIRGAVFPVVGNVCMDMLMVELGPATETTGIGPSVVVGDTAVLWGPYEDDQGDGLVRLQDIAAKLKTTQSALTCGIDKERVSRLYV